MENLLYLLLFVMIFSSMTENFSGLYKFKNGRWMHHKDKDSNYRLAPAWGGLWDDIPWRQPRSNHCYRCDASNNRYPIFYKKYD